MKELAVVISNENINRNPIESVDAIKQAGFKNVFIQWYNGILEFPQEELLDYIKKQNLNVIFAHLGYKNMNSIWEDNELGESLINDYIEDIRVCKQNGINLVVMHLCCGTEVTMYNEIGLNRLKKIVEYAKKENVKIAFENTKLKGYLEYVLENIKDDNVGLCYDAGHVHVHFNDEFDISFAKDRIFAVHLHDNDTTKDQHKIPFDGTIDWNSVIKKLKDNGYNGPITLELIYSKHYSDQNINDFFDKGYKVGEKISNMFENKI